MAKIILSVPDDNNCQRCIYRRRNMDAVSESYHCAIFDSRADGERPRICKEATLNHAQ